MPILYDAMHYTLYFCNILGPKHVLACKMPKIDTWCHVLVPEYNDPRVCFEMYVISPLLDFKTVVLYYMLGSHYFVILQSIMYPL